MQGPELQQLAAATGFNPTQDVDEVLAASGGLVRCASLTPCPKPGLLLARGTFNATQIAAAAAAKGGVTTVNYNGVAILEGPKQTHGVAFLNNNTIAVAGDVASVKGAIDRQTATAASLPAAVIAEIAQWSGSEDAVGHLDRSAELAASFGEFAVDSGRGAERREQRLPEHSVGCGRREVQRYQRRRHGAGAGG